MSPSELDTLKMVLVALCDDLEAKVASSSRELAENFPPCPDANDMASLESTREQLLYMRERTGRLLAEARKAMKRLELGDYGYCEECGEFIGLARLKAQPSATLCVSCKSALEDGRRYAPVFENAGLAELRIV